MPVVMGADHRADSMRRSLRERDMAERLRPASACTLETTAAGTGILSRPLPRLGPHASLTVTDVQDGMLTIARRKLAQDPRVEFRLADGIALPFDDNSFAPMRLPMKALAFTA